MNENWWRARAGDLEAFGALVLEQGLPYEEIATVLSLPLGNVKTGLFRARALAGVVLAGGLAALAALVFRPRGLVLRR